MKGIIDGLHPYHPLMLLFFLNNQADRSVDKRADQLMHWLPQPRRRRLQLPQLFGLLFWRGLWHAAFSRQSGQIFGHKYHKWTVFRPCVSGYGWLSGRSGKRSACISGIGTVFDPYESGYVLWARPILKIAGHNWIRGRHRAVRGLEFCLAGSGIFGSALVPIWWACYFADIPK